MVPALEAIDLSAVCPSGDLLVNAHAHESGVSVLELCRRRLR
jgi:hypothetical protein